MRTRRAPRTTGPETSRVELALLAVLAAIGLGSILGFSVFRTWPSLLERQPGAMATYIAAFSVLPRAQIIAAFVVLAAAVVRRVGWRMWTTAFVALYALSLSSELLGTTVGIPFGPYRYAPALGPMWFGHVPLLIPLSWFTMAVPSFALAGAASSRTWRVIVASFVLVAWDLALDPAMTRATVYWAWGSSGSYYGMPLTNLAGWFATGVALMTVLSLLGAERWIDALPTRWVLAFYAANLLLPLGLCVAAGMWPAAVLTVVVLAGCLPLAAVRLRASRRWSAA